MENLCVLDETLDFLKCNSNYRAYCGLVTIERY